MRKFLTTTDLKLLALLLMALDHIYLFFSFTGRVPVWFTELGRLSLPLFFFSMAESFYHTRDRRRYMLRLFTAYLIMEISRRLLMAALPRPDGFVIVTNIFGTLFLTVVALYCLEQLRLRRHNIISLLFYGIFFLYALSLSIFVEGGWFYIILGILLFYTRSHRLAQAVDYVVLSLLVWGAQSSCQWMMIFAAPLFLLYNGEKGRGYKHLFYIFYPVHIWVLYILSVLLYDKLSV